MPQLAQWLRHLASKSNKRWRGAANLGVAAKVPIERIKAKLMIEKKDRLRPHILLYFCPLEAYNNNCQGGEGYELPVADSSYI